MKGAPFHCNDQMLIFHYRHMAEVRRLMSVGPAREKVVPDQEEEYPRSRCLASVQADPESVFLCRQVYDFRQKRILKNPSWCTLYNAHQGEIFTKRLRKCDTFDLERK